MSVFHRVKMPPDNIGICRTCRHAEIVTGAGKLVVICDTINFNSSGPDHVPFRVEECSKYDDRRLTSLSNMKQTAWILMSDEEKKTIGFVSNKQWRKTDQSGRYMDPVDNED